MSPNSSKANRDKVSFSFRIEFEILKFIACSISFLFSNCSSQCSQSGYSPGHTGCSIWTKSWWFWIKVWSPNLKSSTPVMDAKLSICCLLDSAHYFSINKTYIGYIHILYRSQYMLYTLFLYHFRKYTVNTSFCFLSNLSNIISFLKTLSKLH